MKFRTCRAFSFDSLNPLRIVFLVSDDLSLLTNLIKKEFKLHIPNHETYSTRGASFLFVIQFCVKRDMAKYQLMNMLYL